ncbi:MAG: hypothetical protein Q9210_004021 [Variospora velana]
MDPASIFAVISGSVEVALHCGRAVRNLHDLSDKYTSAELSITSMSNSLESVQCAWRHIRHILEGWAHGDIEENKIELHSRPHTAQLHFAVANNKFNFKGSFNSCKDGTLTQEWLQHCVMTACLLNDAELLVSTLNREPYLGYARCEGHCYSHDYPFELANQNGHSQIVKLLLRDSIEDLVHDAIRTDDQDMLAVLLAQGSCLGVLIEAGADLEAVDDMDLDAYRYLALNIPPEAAILGWVPISTDDRECILPAILSQSPNFFPTPDEGLGGRPPYNRAIKTVMNYLGDQHGLRYLRDSGPAFCLDRDALSRFEQYLSGRLRTPEVLASLETIRQRMRGGREALPVGMAF